MPHKVDTSYLTMTEVCARLRLRYPTVLKMVQKGVIKGAYKVGTSANHRYRRWRIPESEVYRIITTRVDREQAS